MQYMENLIKIFQWVFGKYSLWYHNFILNEVWHMGFDQWRGWTFQRRMGIFFFLLGCVVVMVMHWLWMCNGMSLICTLFSFRYIYVCLYLGVDHFSSLLLYKLTFCNLWTGYYCWSGTRWRECLLNIWNQMILSMFQVI